MDCPEKKYQDAAEEVTEYGVCVGSKLDEGKTIPKSSPSSAYARLNELFAASFGAWEWKSSETRYSDKTAYEFVDNSVGSTSPPRLYSLKTVLGAYTPTGFTWKTGDRFSVIGLDKQPKDTGTITATGGSFPATLQFFAYADNDQMPLTAISIDWKDGPTAPDFQNVYTVKGWFKNRKPWCDGTGHKVCQQTDVTPKVFDRNRPCQDETDCGNPNKFDCVVPTEDRLHFGNSFDACATGYYQFTHLYTCLGKGALPSCLWLWDPVASVDRLTNAPCWNGTACVFKPKVQVLDNWGWCNGTCNTNGVVGGCWQADELGACKTSNPEPWTRFGGVIEIKP